MLQYGSRVMVCTEPRFKSQPGILTVAGSSWTTHFLLGKEMQGMFRWGSCSRGLTRAFSSSLRL